MKQRSIENTTDNAFQEIVARKIHSNSIKLIPVLLKLSCTKKILRLQSESNNQRINIRKKPIFLNYNNKTKRYSFAI